jgi:hypothetical protein
MHASVSFVRGVSPRGLIAPSQRTEVPVLVEVVAAVSVALERDVRTATW